ncbi:MAG: glycerol-3-phosphate 1-O-acyltransferase PlsY [Gammaproteobacteria bacterium]
MLILEIVVILVSYALGSVSSAILVCRLSGLPDPRTAGSKNPGATNVLRLGGKFLAGCVLAGDVIKGILPVYVASLFFPMWVVSCCWLAAFLGHVWPVFFRFQGGKGVATAFGGLLALHWPLALGTFGVWLAVAMITRYSSLAALLSAIVCPILTWWMLDSLVASTALMISSILLYRHKANIVRLLQGQESKIGQKSNKKLHQRIEEEDVIEK